MLTFLFTDVTGYMSESEELTSGMVGKQVQILVDEGWQNLSKTYVFRAGEVCRTADGTDPITTIPEEVLAQPFQKLYVGVYCTDAEGKLVIPTVMAEGPLIRYGADPTEDPAGTELPVWKKLQAQIGNPADLETANKSSLVAAINELCFKSSLSSGGLSKEAAALLIQILRAAVYTSNQTVNIANLELKLTASSAGQVAPTLPSEPENPEVTLTHISAAYSGGSVPVGTPVQNLTGIEVVAFYSDGSLEPVTGYTLSGTIAEGSNSVTVSYSGMDATFTVTGIPEPAEEPEGPKLLHYWDYTQSLTDSVGGAEMVCSGATRDENGLHISSGTDRAYTMVDILEKTVEIEFGPVSSGFTGHGRAVTLGAAADISATSYSCGLVWHSTGCWAWYNGSWHDSTNSNKDALSNATVKMTFNKTTETDVLMNGDTLVTYSPNNAYKFLGFGSDKTAFFSMTVKKLKIYEGV